MAPVAPLSLTLISLLGVRRRWHKYLAPFGKVDIHTDEYVYKLMADLNVQCYTPHHVFLIMILGLPNIAVYVIGIPAAALFFITKSN